MILLKASLLDGIKNTAAQSSSGDLQSAAIAISDTLQKAVELEHATIPLYLYALYSLIDGKNDSIAEIIRSVVVEEMLHMTLACNIMNAIGGCPSIDSKEFLPCFPGPLPGGVESQLRVHLAPFSLDQLETFLTIEEPEDPIKFKALAEAVGEESITIGQFYKAILEALQNCGEGIFVDPPNRQVGSKYIGGAIEVTNLDTAKAAIETIVDQGEGTETSPLEGPGEDVAHFYRYMEIKMGYKLVPVQNPPPNPRPDQLYSYSGDPVPFDSSGVYAVPIDPQASDYPKGTLARTQCETFNYTYTSLLKTLHQAFNGQPELLGGATTLMYSLRGQAKGMMSNTLGAGNNTGPSFEYQPVNPAPGNTP